MYKLLSRFLPAPLVNILLVFIYTGWIAIITAAAVFFPTVGFRYLDI